MFVNIFKWFDCHVILFRLRKTKYWKVQNDFCVFWSEFLSLGTNWTMKSTLLCIIYIVCLLLYVCSDRSCSVKSGLISTFDTLIWVHKLMSHLFNCWLCFKPVFFQAQMNQHFQKNPTHRISMQVWNIKKVFYVCWFHILIGIYFLCSYFIP